MHRAHVDDDAAAVALVHVLERGAGGEEAAVQVDRQHLLPVGELELVDRVDDLHAGVGDQDVQRAEVFHHLIGAGLDRRLVGDVHGDAERLAAGLDDGRGGGLRRLPVDVADRHLGAFLGVELGDRLADAAGRAGDQGDLAVETVHGCFLLRLWVGKRPF